MPLSRRQRRRWRSTSAAARQAASSSAGRSPFLPAIGVLTGLAVGVLLLRGLFLAAGLVLIPAGVFDVLDGAVARHRGTASRGGAFLDSFLDRISDLIVFGAITLVTGPLWARKAWGVWWVWDPRLTLSLVLWMIFGAYLLLRKYGGPGSDKLAAGLALFGMANVPFIYISVNYWRTIHPATSVVPTLPTSMGVPFWFCFTAFLLLFVLLWIYSSRPRPVGAVSGAFLLGYGLFRFAAEFFREPDAHLGLLSLGLSMGQWLCVPMVVAGVWLMRLGGRAASA